MSGELCSGGPYAPEALNFVGGNRCSCSDVQRDHAERDRPKSAVQRIWYRNRHNWHIPDHAVRHDRALSVRFDTVVLLVAPVFASFARLPIDATDLPDHKPRGWRNEFNAASFVFGLLADIAHRCFNSRWQHTGMPLNIP